MIFLIDISLHDGSKIGVVATNIEVISQHLKNGKMVGTLRTVSGQTYTTNVEADTEKDLDAREHLSLIVQQQVVDMARMFQAKMMQDQRGSGLVIPR